ncbi:MAG: hypothetical protein CM15mP58_17660 [Burkholderiaceae bacterium]|nr:MAG: hypothetical protein CM15mP58_17660 [Burkholderiaceae bacterium]
MKEIIFVSSDQFKEIEENKQVAIYYCSDNGKTEENIQSKWFNEKYCGYF